MTLPSRPTFSPQDYDYFACVREVVSLVWCVCVPATFHITGAVVFMWLVGFKLHITSHYSTPHHIKRFHIIPSHHTKRFYFTPPSTSHHSTSPLHNIPHHVTTYHMFHATSHRHLMSQHVSPRTTIFYIWHRITNTAVCLPPPFHTTTSRSTTYSTSHSHSPHLAPFHIHNYTTPHPHSASQHISHHTIFHITLHHHIWHQNTLHHFSHLTSHNNRAAHCTCRILHHHISHHDVTFHILHYPTFHIPGHHIPHRAVFHITHFAFQLYHVWNCNIPHRTTFHIPRHVSYRTIIHIRSLAISRHTIPHHAHIPPRHHAMHITTLKYNTSALSHSTHSTLYFNHHSASITPPV